MSDDTISRGDVEALGGLRAFRSGEWLPNLLRMKFKSYFNGANSERVRAKFADIDQDVAAQRLIAAAAKTAAALGAATGAAISADEFAGMASAGLGLPANIAVGIASVCAESVGLVGIYMKLVASLASLYRVQLDADDPEDFVTILLFALGTTGEQVGNWFTKFLGRTSGRVAKWFFSGKVLSGTKRVGAVLGVKILQRQIVKYTIPLVSVGLGAGWNYYSTICVGRIAMTHFKTLAAAATSPPQE